MPCGSRHGRLVEFPDLPLFTARVAPPPRPFCVCGLFDECAMACGRCGIVLCSRDDGINCIILPLRPPSNGVGVGDFPSDSDNRMEEETRPSTLTHHQRTIEHPTDHAVVVVGTCLHYNAPPPPRSSSRSGGGSSSSYTGEAGVGVPCSGNSMVPATSAAVCLPVCPSAATGVQVVVR